MKMDPPSSKHFKRYQSAAPELPKQLVATSGGTATLNGTVLYVRCHNKSAAVVYLFLFSGALGTGTLIAGPIACPINGEGVIDVRDVGGLPYVSGLGLGVSTTDASYTADASADVWFTVLYQPTVN